MWICKCLKKHCFSLNIRHFRPIALLRCRRGYFLFFSPNFPHISWVVAQLGFGPGQSGQLKSVAISKVSGDVATNIAVAQACILQRQWTRAAELYLLAFALVVLAPWADCLSSQDLKPSVNCLHQWCVIVRGMLELGMLPSHPAGITKRRFLNSPKHVGVEKNAFKKGLL